MIKSWLGFYPAAVLLMALAANHADLRESWELREPGARHAEDVDPLVRGGWRR